MSWPAWRAKVTWIKARGILEAEHSLAAQSVMSTPGGQATATNFNLPWKLKVGLENPSWLPFPVAGCHNGLVRDWGPAGRLAPDPRA